MRPALRSIVELIYLFICAAGMLVGVMWLAGALGCAAPKPTKGGDASFTQGENTTKIVMPDGLVLEYTGDNLRSNSTQPENPKTEGMASPKGASTGAAFGFDQSIGQLNVMVWVGMGLVAAGLISAFCFPIAVPRRASFVVAAVGGLFIIGPTIVDRYSGIIFILGVLGLVGIIAWVIINKRSEVGRDWQRGKQVVLGVEKALAEVDPGTKQKMHTAMSTKHDQDTKDWITELKLELKREGKLDKV